MKIPVFLPVTREFGFRDEFASRLLRAGSSRPASASLSLCLTKRGGEGPLPLPPLSPINCNPSAYFATTAPPGVGAGRGEFLKPDDVVKLWIEKIGSLTNTMV